MQLLDIPFEISVSGVEEIITKTMPEEIVEELSGIKAEDVFRKNDGELLVIGADTVVAADGKILGKPRDAEEAKQMLSFIQGRSHAVYTGVTLMWRQERAEHRRQFHERTEVTFYPMNQQEIEWYTATGEPMDKAGAYGIQGLGARFVREIHGDYNNVVGLPLSRLYKELRKIPLIDT